MKPAPPKSDGVEFQLLPLDKIQPSPGNPRKNFGDAKLAELAESIRSKGVLQPILVRPRRWSDRAPFKELDCSASAIKRLGVLLGSAAGRGLRSIADVESLLVHLDSIGGARFVELRRIGLSDAEANELVDALYVFEEGTRQKLGFELVAGERRLRAAKLAGLAEIPAIVRDMTDADVLEAQVVENDQREDLDPIERAVSYQRLLDEAGHTVESLAARIGRSKASLYGFLKLTRLPDGVRKALCEGKLSLSVAQLLARLPSDDMIARAAKAVLDPTDKVLEELLGASFNWEWENKFTPGEPLSFRAAKELLETAFTRELKQAPWPLRDLKLVPEAGSCQACPKRTGNNRDEFPEGRADVCTDPDCFARKLAAHRVKQKESYADRGITVIPKEEAAKHFSGDRLRFDGGYKAADSLELIGDKIQKLRDAVGRELAKELVILETPGGELIETYPTAQARAAIEGKFPGAKDGAGSKSQADDQKKQKLLAEVGRRCQSKVAEAARIAFSSVALGDKARRLLRLLVVDHGQHCWADVQKAVVRNRRGPEAASNYDDETASLADNLNSAELFGLWAELAGARAALSARSGGGPGEQIARVFFAEFGVSWDAAKKEVAGAKGAKKAKEAVAAKGTEADREDGVCAHCSRRGTVLDVREGESWKAAGDDDDIIPLFALPAEFRRKEWMPKKPQRTPAGVCRFCVFDLARSKNQECAKEVAKS